MPRGAGGRAEVETGDRNKTHNINKHKKNKQKGAINLLMSVEVLEVPSDVSTDGYYFDVSPDGCETATSVPDLVSSSGSDTTTSDSDAPCDSDVPVSNAPCCSDVPSLRSDTDDTSDDESTSALAVEVSSTEAPLQHCGEQLGSHTSFSSVEDTLENTPTEGSKCPTPLLVSSATKVHSKTEFL